MKSKQLPESERDGYGYDGEEEITLSVKISTTEFAEIISRRSAEALKHAHMSFGILEDGAAYLYATNEHLDGDAAGIDHAVLDRDLEPMVMNHFNRGNLDDRTRTITWFEQMLAKLKADTPQS